MNAQIAHAQKLHTGRRSLAVVAALSSALLLTLIGCAPEPTGSGVAPAPAESGQAEKAAEEVPAETEATPEARTQAETCDWGSGPLTAGATAPTGQEGDLMTVIIGSWQHTHIDGAPVYEAGDPVDIRYVFPQTSRLLYCQDVPGMTDQAENATDFTWDGNKMVLGPAEYTVEAWNDSSMVWTNHRDGTSYLLQRR